MLVDYASSDDESSPPIATNGSAEASTAPVKAGGLFASLPPVASAGAAASPTPATASPSKPNAATSSSGIGLSLPAPRKKQQAGPVKIMLETSTRSNDAVNDEELERARKRARTTLGGSGGLKGLAGMLPAPKSKSRPAPPTTAPAPADDDPERAQLKAMLDGEPIASTSTASISFVPHKAAKSSMARPAPSTPTVDFFSLGGASTSRHAVDDTAASSSTSFSAAPTIAEHEPEPPKPNYYSTLPEASLSNPYPGFHPLPSGDWTPDDPAAWAEWVDINGWSKKPTPADDGIVDVNGSDLSSKKEAEKPGRVIEDDKRQAPSIRKSQNSLAKGRHQLSHMLHSAFENRQELEDKIALAKANRRSAATKYGF